MKTQIKFHGAENKQTKTEAGSHSTAWRSKAARKQKLDSQQQLHSIKSSSQPG